MPTREDPAQPPTSEPLWRYAGTYEGALIRYYDGQPVPEPCTLELRANGNFHHTSRWANKPPQTSPGKFRVDGDRLILRLNSSHSTVLRVLGPKLVEGEGGQAELVRVR